MSTPLLTQCDHACKHCTIYKGSWTSSTGLNPTTKYEGTLQSHTASWLYNMQTRPPFNAVLVGSSRPDHHSHYTSCERDCRISSVWTSVGLPFLLCSWSRNASHLLARVRSKANSSTLWRSSLLNSCSWTRRLRTAERKWYAFNYIHSHMYMS